MWLWCDYQLGTLTLEKATDICSFQDASIFRIACGNTVMHFREKNGQQVTLLLQKKDVYRCHYLRNFELCTSVKDTNLIESESAWCSHENSAFGALGKSRHWTQLLYTGTSAQDNALIFAIVIIGIRFSCKFGIPLELLTVNVIWDVLLAVHLLYTLTIILVHSKCK